MKRHKKQVQLFFKKLKTHADPFHRNMAPEAELTVSMGYSFKRERWKICDALRDLLPFVQFKEREKHTQRSVIFKY